MGKHTPDLGPPWVLFLVDGRPEAILPAGRPGEVANVRGVSRSTVNRIIAAANESHSLAVFAQIDKTTKALREGIDAFVAKAAPPKERT